MDRPTAARQGRDMREGDGATPNDQEPLRAWATHFAPLLDRVEAATTVYLGAVIAGAAPAEQDRARRAWHAAVNALTAAVRDLEHRVR
jgi:hypothetical protein